MAAYIIRRLLLLIPTLFGIMLISFAVVQFAPGGPVERIIAQMSGSATGADSRVPGGGQAGDFGAQGQLQGAGEAGGLSSKHTARAGSIRPSSKPRRQFGLDRRRTSASSRCCGTICASFRQELFPRHWCSAHQRSSRVDFARVMDHALTYLISIPLGIRKALHDGSRFDVWTSSCRHHRLRHSGVPVCIFLIILFAGGSYLDLFHCAV
jgi:microcin C transport system permease protein